MGPCSGSTICLSTPGHPLPAVEGSSGPTLLLGGVCYFIPPCDRLQDGAEGDGRVQEGTTSSPGMYCMVSVNTVDWGLFFEKTLWLLETTKI